MHQVFDALEFRVLRDRLFATLQARRAGGRRKASTSRARSSTPGQLAGWLEQHAKGDVRTGVHVQGSWGRGTGDIVGVALASSDGAAAWVEPTELSPDDDKALAEWLADPDHEKALHDAKGPMLALAARGWALAWRDERHGAVGLPRPARPADLRSRRPDAALPPSGAAVGGAGRRPAQPRRSRRDERHPRDRDGGGPSCDRPRRPRLDEELSERGGAQLLQDVELPLVDVLARLEQAGICVDVERLSRPRSPLRRPAQAGCRRGLPA